MKYLKNQYSELLNLTQLFLLREYSLKDTKMVDPAINDFLKQSIKNSTKTLPIEKTPQLPPIVPPQQGQVKSLAKPEIPPSPLRSETIAKPFETPLKHLQAKPNQLTLQPETTEKSFKPPAIENKIDGHIENKEVKRKCFQLEPLPSAPLQEHADEWKLYSTLFPQWMLSQSIPNDDIALKQKNAWLRTQEISPIMILSFHDNAQQLAFLKNIAQAITLRLAPAQVVSATRIEKKNGWDAILSSPALRLVIAGDYGLYLHPKLTQFHREVPRQGKHFLNETPLLLLSDLSLYLKEPQLKSLLWRAVCNEFAASQSHDLSENNLNTHSSIQKSK